MSENNNKHNNNTTTNNNNENVEIDKDGFVFLKDIWKDFPFTEKNHPDRHRVVVEVDDRDHDRDYYLKKYARMKWEQKNLSPLNPVNDATLKNATPYQLQEAALVQRHPRAMVYLARWHESKKEYQVAYQWAKRAYDYRPPKGAGIRDKDATELVARLLLDHRRDIATESDNEGENVIDLVSDSEDSVATVKSSNNQRKKKNKHNKVKKENNNKKATKTKPKKKKKAMSKSKRSKENKAQGLHLLKMAAANGAPQAALKLGRAHAKGKYGLKKDHYRATTWLKRSLLLCQADRNHDHKSVKKHAKVKLDKLYKISPL